MNFTDVEKNTITYWFEAMVANSPVYDFGDLNLALKLKIIDEETYNDHAAFLRENQ